MHRPSQYVPVSVVPVKKVDGKAQVRPSHSEDPGRLVDKQCRVKT